MPSYSEKLEQIIVSARGEASKFGQAQVGPDHWLLALMIQERIVMVGVFGSVDNFIAAGREIRDRTEKSFVKISAMGIPNSQSTEEMLIFARAVQKTKSHRHLAAPHLLFGMLRQEGTLAAEVLKKYGVTEEAIRQRMD